MIALAAYTPHQWHDVGGRLICWWTRSPYSHVEIVINGVCYSSSLRDGGVRSKTINLARAHWRVIPITWRDPDDALRVFRRHAGEPYGYGDLLAQHVLRLPVDFRGPTCSELAALMLGLPRAERIDPAWITDYCESRRTDK